MSAYFFTFTGYSSGCLAFLFAKYYSTYFLYNGNLAIAYILSGPALTCCIVVMPKASAQATKPCQLCIVTGCRPAYSALVSSLAFAESIFRSLTLAKIAVSITSAVQPSGLGMMSSGVSQ